MLNPIDDFERQLRDRVIKGEEFYNTLPGDLDDLIVLGKQIQGWHTYNITLLRKAMFPASNRLSESYSSLISKVYAADILNDLSVDYLQRFAIVKKALRAQIDNLDLLLNQLPLLENHSKIPDKFKKQPKKECILIHGHDKTFTLQVDKYLRDSFDLKAIIVEDEHDRHASLLLKFASLSEADFAVALWTADDLGGTVNSPMESYKERARQNVIFETGFLMGKLDINKVIVILEHGVEKPSNMGGFVCIPRSDWKDRLRKNVEAIYKNW